MDLPLHPKLVHLPVALAVLLPLLSAVLWVAIVRSWLPLRAWWLGTAAQALLVVSGIVAMQSGEADEERVERVVSEAVIERHEEAAQTFVFASGAVLLLTVLPFVLRRRPRLAAHSIGGVALATLVVLGLGWRVGASGGELVYRHGAAAAFAGSGAAPVGDAVPLRRDDDDDR